MGTGVSEPQLDVTSSDGGSYLRKFLNRSFLFDLVVFGVLGLDVYLLQQSETFSRQGLTSVPPPSLDIAAAQLTLVIMVLKLIDGYLDSSH
jgi:hypothetical protein